ncbi:hypothetical protein [Marinobacterium jannaschii]|uniref:hypothetical protein n=1 Tax=Marinobacterium jannaschii TaxID=64970 RepID=UPI0004830A56|nr:hypothetical protein [Marinobacterium jannaschii]
MSRTKKKRSDANVIIFENAPRRSEKLADPDSYESRKKRALEKKKKNKSVYAKTLEENKKAENKGAQANRGPLADKIRKLNAAKAKSENADG